MDDTKYSLSSLPGNKKSLEQKLQSGQIVRLFPYKYQGASCTRVIAPIGEPGHLIGYLSVITDPERAESDLENVAIEQGAIVLALEMMKVRIKTEVESRYRGEFLDDLLTGAYGSDEGFYERAGFFGYNFGCPTRVAVAVLRKKNKNIVGAGIHREYVKNTFAEVFPDCFTARKKNNLVVMVPVTSEQDNHELAAGFKKIHEKIVQQCPDFNMTLGIGNVCRGLSDYQESYHQAIRAMAFARPELCGAQVIFYEELGVFGLLAEIKDQNILSKFVNSKLGPLLAYDPKKSQSFIETLDEYIKSGNSLKDTAETLHIHIGTLKYRLRRIREILDIMEFSAEILFDLRVALCANRLLSE
jgi:sugar diacid utilization regulator